MKLQNLILAGLIGFWPASELAAGGVARAVARSVGRRLQRSAAARAAVTLRGDLLRDRATAAKPLARPRTVFRFTTRQQAWREAAMGIAPGRHMTATAKPGRPPAAATAQHRYGLPRRPEVRETIRLPTGQPVRHNRALGGSPGVGELTSSERVPPEAIRKVVPLK